MHSARIPQPNEIEIIERPEPQPGDHEAIIQVMASGICGTDLHIFRGEYLGKYPVVPGHEFSGIITATGSQVTRFRVGDRVAVEPNIACGNCEACLNNRQNFCKNWQAVGVTLPGAMAQYVAVPENSMFAISDLPYEQAAFVEPLSCVIHGAERAGIRMGDRVAIWGAGPIGLLMLQVVRQQGAAEVTVVERNPTRLAAAEPMGADQSYEDLGSLEGDSYDVVIDATGAIPMMAASINYARPGGTVLWFGVPSAGQQLQLEPFRIFQKGLKVVSSFTSLRNSYQAVHLLRSGQVNVTPIISHQLPLVDFPRALELIESHAPGVQKVIIQPNS